MEIGKNWRNRVTGREPASAFDHFFERSKSKLPVSRDGLGWMGVI
jgi:hypothetical protein